MGYVQRFLQDLQETKRAAVWCRESGIPPTTFSAVARGTRDPTPEFAAKLLPALDETQILAFLWAYVKDMLPRDYHHYLHFSSPKIQEDPSARMLTRLDRAKSYLMERSEQDTLLAAHLISLASLISEKGIFEIPSEGD